MSKKKNDSYYNLENVARMLETVSSRERFATVSKGITKAEVDASKMKYRVTCRDELQSKFLVLLDAFRQIDWMVHGVKAYFPAPEIVKILGILPQNPAVRIDDWIDEFISNEGLIEFFIADEDWLSEDGVLTLINGDNASFPVWVRDKLSNWFKRYCAEVKARNIFA